jgi:thiosulfate/3-mercaptopyruvate sulfurtransferase
VAAKECKLLVTETMPNRRTFLTATWMTLFAPLLRADEPTSDPWPKDALIEPSELAKILTGSQKPPVIISVVFPVLYRQRRILHAKLAGPTSKPEGISALKQAVADLPRNANVVIYCGCCPMVRCPNIRPAYSALKDLRYTNVHVLNLLTNLHTDWTQKGYPVEPAPA